MYQVLITGETTSDRTVTHPIILWQHLLSLAEELGLDHPHAQSLVYSTPFGNTGWTGFIFAPNGHISLHHWDAAEPAILQLDLAHINVSIRDSLIEKITKYWRLTNAKILSIDRNTPLACIQLQGDVLSRKLDRRTGTGPNGHIHLLINATIPEPLVWSHVEARVSALIRNLVPKIDMHALTDCYSVASQPDGGWQGSIMGITTSHISVHVVKKQTFQSVFVDVFSCKSFDPKVVLESLHDHLGVSSSDAAIYFRYPEVSLSIV